ncbi:hypothetical protein BC830DRAFT_96246 [Chytriomyces sp. MP71]|nr:hypothetical protein BC830DRAFT_96246 [Chytriomyces sp. MP71]
MSYQDIWSFKVTELETIITEKDELVKFMKKALLDSENRYSDLKIDYLELVSRHQSWSLMDQEKNVTVTQLGVPMAEKNDGTEQFKEALEGMESFNLQIVEINAKVIDEEDSQDSLSRSLTTSCQFSGPKNIDAQLAGANHEVESDADAKNPLDLSRSQSKEMNLDDGQPLFDITAADSYSQSKLSMTQTQSRSESTGSNMVLESRTLAAASRPPAKLKLVEATIESIKTEMRISLKPVLDSMRSPKETSSSDLIPKIGGLNDWEIPDKIEDAWIVPIKTNMQDALKEIDILMHQEKDNIRLISKFRPGPMGAVVLREGEIAVWNGHHISVSMQPGYYWNSKKWIGNFDTTKPLRVQGLTASLVSPNEVAVVIGPGKLVFIAKPPGFAAFTLKDSFQLLEFVNIKELGSETLITEKLPNGKPGAVLGRKKEVLSDDQSVANFYEVPAKVVLILKNDDELILLRTGLHVVTNSKIKFHGFYSIGDTIQFTTEPVKTSDGIQVILEVAVKYKVTDPLLLASNYGSLLEALRCPTQAAVSALLTRMTFSQFQRSQQITRKDVTFSSEDNQLDNLKSATLEEFQKVMKEFGIDVRAFYGWSL